MLKAAHSFCVKFTWVGRALSRAGFVTDLPTEGRSTPTHRHFQPSRRECGMPNVTSPLILSACGNGGQHFAFSPLLSQRNRGTCDLAPAITVFISHENRVCCNNDLEQTPMLLHSSLGWAGRFPGLDSPLTYLLKAVRHQRIAISNQVGGNVKCLTLRLP
jgi:hypothetical protein